MLYYTPQNSEGKIILCNTQAEADKISPTYSSIEVETSKNELRDLLQQSIDKIHRLENLQPVKESLSYTEWSVQVDDCWEKLPLARKLHFAALALEEARDKHIK